MIAGNPTGSSARETIPLTAELLSLESHSGGGLKTGLLSLCCRLVGDPLEN